MSVIMSRPAHDPKYAGAEKETAAGVAAEFAACVKLPAMAKNIQSAADALTSTAADISAVCGTITAAVG